MLAVITLLSLCVSALGLAATPTDKPGPYTPSLVRRTDPTFPADIPSCVQCQSAYPSINTCAQAAPVFENATQVRIFMTPFSMARQFLTILMIY
jgi:hypothetical protein